MPPTDKRSPEPDAPAGAPPLVAMPPELLAELLGLVRSRAESDGASPVTERMLTALEGIAAGNKRLGEEFARTVRRSNAQASGFTVFAYDRRCDYCTKKQRHPVVDETGAVVLNAEGPYAHPKPKLVHKVFVCGGPQTEESLTPLEIELFNQFTHSKTAHNGAYTAMLRRDGTSSVLTIDFPAKSLDNLQDLPRSLAELLAELLYGDEATDAQDLVGEVMRLKKRLAELESVSVRTAPPTVDAPAAAAV